MSDTSWPPRPTPWPPADPVGGPAPAGSGPRGWADGGTTPITAGYHYERPGSEAWPPTPSGPSPFHQPSGSAGPTSAATAGHSQDQAESSESIGRYAAPRRPSGLIILLVAVALVVVAAVILTFVVGPDEPTVETTPTAMTTPGRSGGIAIESDGVKGYWLITTQHWDGDMVTATVEITVDEGLLYYDFYAFGNDDAETFTPLDLTPNSLTAGYVSADQVLVGTVTFVSSRQDLTLVMSDGYATQISALPIHR